MWGSLRSPNHAKSRLNTPVWGSLRSPNYTIHTEHAYCLSFRFLNNVVITTVIEMVEMVEILDGRLGKRSVERVRYVINNLLHLVIVKYGSISLVLLYFHSPSPRDNTIATREISSSSLTRVISLIGRAKRPPHWGVQSRFCVISESAVALSM